MTDAIPAKHDAIFSLQKNAATSGASAPAPARATAPAAPVAGPPATATAITGFVVVAELKKLAELKSQGLLSDAEFTAAKKKFLGA